MISRREILAGLTILPSRLRAAPPSEKVNLAFIGLGTYGARGLRELASHNVVAVCDVDWRAKSQMNTTGAVASEVVLTRAAAVHPDRVAAIHGEHRITYRQLEDRARRLASGLARRGIRPGQTVSAMLPNVPAMLEAHFGVPMLGAVLNTINTRLDARTVAYILEHGESKALITDREYAAVVGPALKQLGRRLLVIDVDDPLYEGAGERLGEVEYEAFLSEGSPDFADKPPADERQAIALNYTRERRATPRASSTAIAAPIWRRSATSWPGRCPPTPSISGRCRCSTATAGTIPGQ